MADTHDQLPLILGSASPRRADLLTALRIGFEVETVAIDERSLVDDHAGTASSVVRIARAKFDAFAAVGIDPPRLLLTADTLVSCDGAALGKPDSDDHLSHMLQQMSGRTLTIATAVCVGHRGSTPTTQVVTTVVTLRSLSADEIEAYVATGVGLDKAGGLALQSEAGPFIDTVEGCWSNVLGLPLCAVAQACDLPPAGRTQLQRCSVDLCGHSYR